MNDELTLPCGRLPCSINNRDGKLFPPKASPWHTAYYHRQRQSSSMKASISFPWETPASTRTMMLVPTVPSSSPLEMHMARQGPLGYTTATSSATSATSSTTLGSSSTALATHHLCGGQAEAPHHRHQDDGPWRSISPGQRRRLGNDIARGRAVWKRGE